MSNGARPGVLLSELLSGDGPFITVAEEFLTNLCAGCGRTVDRDGVHYDEASYCSPCWSRRSAGT
jgi:hypothetical protein